MMEYLKESNNYECDTINNISIDHNDLPAVYFSKENNTSNYRDLTDIEEQKHLLDQLHEIRDLLIIEMNNSEVIDPYLNDSAREYATNPEFRKIGLKSIKSNYLNTRNKLLQKNTLNFEELEQNFLEAITTINLFDYSISELPPAVIDSLRDDMCWFVLEDKFWNNIIAKDMSATTLTWYLTKEAHSEYVAREGHNKEAVVILQNRCWDLYTRVINKIKEKEKAARNTTEETKIDSDYIVEPKKCSNEYEKEDSEYKTRELVRCNGKIVPKNIDAINDILEKIKKISRTKNED